MKHLTGKPLLALLILLIFLLSGCGSDTPEDVSENFIHKISQAKFDEGKKLANDSAKKTIDRLKESCSDLFARQLAKETLAALKQIRTCNKISKKDVEEMFKSTFSEEEIKSEVEKIKTKFDKEYGDMERAPESELKKALYELVWKVASKAYKPQKMLLEKCGIRPKHLKDVSILAIAQALFHQIGLSQIVSYGSLYNLSKSYISKKLSENIDSDFAKECLDKETDFGYVKSIKVIESKKSSPDKISVRVELLSEKGKSKKSSIDLELIQDKWLVSDFQTDIPVILPPVGSVFDF